MTEYIVTLPQYQRQIAVTQSITLHQLLRQEGIGLDAPCGGNGTCGKCRVFLQGKEVLACQTMIDRDMTVLLPEEKRERILTRGKGALWQADGQNPYVMAFDIGTTTVVGYLMDGKTGDTLSTVSCPNPQREFGADVISRLQHATQGNSGKLQKMITDTLSRLIGEACKSASVLPADIGLISLVGNTCMHHLALGIDVKSLATPPYSANVTDALVLEAGGLLPCCPEARIRVLPNISGFVGADTVGCLLASRADSWEDWTLLVDIGTNGEMVLGKGNTRIACSTAAGPAFEGAKIERGMRGAVGAIDHVWLEDGAIQYSVIGGKEPTGICGSGLLDAVAVLLETGAIEQNGRMKGKKYQFTDKVYLSQKDVRQVQLAKSAIRAGIELMAKAAGIQTAHISRVLLAGAFGNHLSPEAACAIGLLPPVLKEKITPIGNAAGEGAKAAAVSEAAFAASKQLAEKTQFLELATLSEFQRTYIKLLDFREVDLWNN